jgi:ATP-dependent Lon protease
MSPAVKEQMNKRKPDDEFARIDLSFINSAGDEVVVFCPESKDAIATQQPARRRLRRNEVETAPDEQSDPVSQPGQRPRLNL